jgi:hypothetical protein
VVLDAEAASDSGDRILCHSSEKRIDDFGFADPGLAGHEHELALPTSGSGQMLVQARDLYASVQGFERAGSVLGADIAGRCAVETELLVCADGAQSETRRRLLPNLTAHYAG